MTMYKLTATEKTDKARTRYHFEHQQEATTLCVSCIHRPDLAFNCQDFSQVSGENRNGLLIVLSCDGYQVAP